MTEIKLLEIKMLKLKKRKVLIKMCHNPVWALDPKLYEHQ